MKTKIEQKPDEARSGSPKFSIETAEDHHLANERIKALKGSSRDEAAECELDALKQAVARWERKPH